MFLDNAPVHPENLVGKYSNIKIVFLRKYTTSRLQPLYTGIFKNFKVKYRKTLLRHVIARISNDRSASDIAKEVDILQAIPWVATVWNKVLETTIKNCFCKVWHCATSSSKWRIWVGCRVCWTLQRAHRDKRSWKRFHSWGTYWFWYWNFKFSPSYHFRDGRLESCVISRSYLSGFLLFYQISRYLFLHLKFLKRNYYNTIFRAFRRQDRFFY